MPLHLHLRFGKKTYYVKCHKSIIPVFILTLTFYRNILSAISVHLLASHFPLPSHPRANPIMTNGSLSRLFSTSFLFSNKGSVEVHGRLNEMLFLSVILRHLRNVFWLFCL